jgi:hypothetical protein
MERNNQTEYAAVGIANQGTRGSRSYSESRVYYKALNVVQFDRETEYDQLQIRTPTTGRNKISQTEYNVSQSTSSISGTKFSNGNVNSRRSRGCIAIFMLLTVLGLFAVVALAIGALGLERSLTAQHAIEEASRNYTHLMEEISALKVFLEQLNLETQANMSQLSDGLSSVNSLSSLVSSVSTKASSNSISIFSLSRAVSYCTRC